MAAFHVAFAQRRGDMMRKRPQGDRIVSPEQDDVALVPEMRKPFDVLAEGLVGKDGRGDWIRTSDLVLPKHAR